MTIAGRFPSGRSDSTPSRGNHSAKNTSRRILKNDSQERDFDTEIEEAKTLRDILRLDRQDALLWSLAVFLILLLTLFILVKDLEVLNLSPREWMARAESFSFSALILPAALLVLVFCVYLVYKNRKIRRRRKDVFVEKIKLERMIGSREEVAALFQITSGVMGHKDLPALLEIITRESLHCLAADRSTLFVADEKSGILKSQFSCSSDPLHEQVGLFEEKEVARRALRQKKPFLLRGPRDFAEFPKYESRDRKITSLLSLPLISQETPMGVLSVVLVDEERKFTEKDLQFLKILGNQACIAFENSQLLEEVRKGVDFRKNYEQYLDHILNQLQTLSDVERKRIEEHIGRLLPGQPKEEPLPLAEQDEEVVKGTMPIAGPSSAEGEKEPDTRTLQVDLEGEALSASQDLGDGGVFIRTPNPLDLGEQFVFKLALGDGKPPIELTGKVVWTNKYGKESKHLRRGMGVKLLNVPHEFQNRVEEFIRSHKNKPFTFAEDPRQFSLRE